jgi:hypothetical protein
MLLLYTLSCLLGVKARISIHSHLVSIIVLIL